MKDIDDFENEIPNKSLISIETENNSSNFSYLDVIYQEN